MITPKISFNVSIPKDLTWPEYKKIFLAELPGVLEKIPAEDYKGVLFLSGEGVEFRGVIIPEGEYAELLKARKDFQTLTDIINYYSKKR